MPCARCQDPVFRDDCVVVGVVVGDINASLGRWYCNSCASVRIAELEAANDRMRNVLEAIRVNASDRSAREVAAVVLGKKLEADQ